MSKKTIKNNENIIEIISKMFQNARQDFEPYIEYIRFPRYRNFEVGTQITFDFPFTVFIGKNGSGKSSALHALYGVPKDHSTATFWFSTPIDPIEEDKKKPHCHIHGYRYVKNDKYQYEEDGNEKKVKILEALKTRINSQKYGLDYWEPSRPLYGMSKDVIGKTRNPVIIKNVIYLDFRAELSAFDKYFYFGNFQTTKTLKSKSNMQHKGPKPFQNKQDVLRRWAKELRIAIDEGKEVSRYTKRHCSQPVVLTPEEIDSVKSILGKPYNECLFVNHNFYEGKSENGTTIYFRTDLFNYSEAFAGRGEFAVVKLVHEIHKSENHSLVLLDEPEVSLHPGAQRKLKEYLLQMIQQKHLQVVVSTHSEHFIEGLPDTAIKLFEETSQSQVHIYDRCHPFEAFRDIGRERLESDKAVIIVEDNVAKIIVENVLNVLRSGLPEMFRVEYYQGGADDLFKSAIGYSEENESRKFLLLDGDKRKDISNPDSLPSDTDFIEEIKKVVGLTKPPFRLDSGSNHNSQKQKSAKRYLQYLYTNCSFLPKTTPETIIWDEEFVKTFPNLSDDFSTKISTIADTKAKIKQLAKDSIGNDDISNIESTVRTLVKHFVEQCKDGETFKSIKQILEKFKTIFENLQKEERG